MNRLTNFGNILSNQNRIKQRLEGRHFLTCAEASEKFKLTKEYLSDLCRADRVPGSWKAGNTWLIPSDFKHKTKKRGWTKGKKRYKPFVRRSEIS